MDTNLIFYCAIAVGVVALVFAYIKYLSITKIEPAKKHTAVSKSMAAPKIIATTTTNITKYLYSRTKKAIAPSSM